MSPTVLTYLFLGASSFSFQMMKIFVAATVWMSGSLGLTGNIVTDPASNASPSLCLGSGCYLTHKEVAITASGTSVVAELQVPTFYQSGAIVLRAYVDCGTTGTTMSGVVAIHPITKQGIGAGTVLRKDIKTASGTTTAMYTGALVNTKIPPAQFLTFTGSGGKTAASAYTNQDCKFGADLRAKHGR